MATNPAWSIDELILALDLYERSRPSLPGNRDHEVVELSRVLNALPIHTTRPDAEKFRNPSGVAMKLANFASVDPRHAGKGLAAAGRLDAVVFQHYSKEPDLLRSVATALRAGATNAGLFPTIPEPDEEEVSADEGRLLYRLHRTRERNAGLVRRKKDQVRTRTGRLACEACGFDFAHRYGALGDGYIECHHIIPLAELGVRTVRLSDLAPLCANCHRMIHRGDHWMTLEELRSTLSAASPSRAAAAMSMAAAKPTTSANRTGTALPI